MRRSYLYALAFYCTVKLVAVIAVPPGVVTEIFAVTAPVGTVVVTCVSEFTVNVAATVPNFTALACERLVPVITTEVPTEPLVGENFLMVGVTLNFCGVTKFPAGITTVTLPVVAPVAGTAVM